MTNNVIRKNIWENIAKAFNIPLEREFTIEEFFEVGVYKFTKDGLERVDCDKPPSSTVLTQLLSGELSVVPKPWKPAKNDTYWYVIKKPNDILLVLANKWTGNMTNLCAYRSGNCFASKEEAEAQMHEAYDKLMKYYNKEEV